MTRRVIALVGASLTGAVALLGADTILVPKVELRESPKAVYVLEAEVAPILLGAVGTPVPPARCRVDPQRLVTDQGTTFLIHYRIDCRGQPLTGADDILLPWTVDGIQLRVVWIDGEERRGLLGREAVGGVVIRMANIVERTHDPVDLVVSNLASGMRHAATRWGHLLLVVGLALLLPIGRMIAVLAGFTAGQAAAMVVAEIGGLGLPSGPAEAAVGGALVVFAATLVGDAETRGSRDGPWAWTATAAILGLLHGLGAATELHQDGIAGPSLVPAVFASNIGVDLVQWTAGLTIVLLVGRRGTPHPFPRTALPRVLGVAGALLLIATLGAAVRTPPREAGTPGFFQTLAPGGGGPGGAIPGQLTAGGRLAAPFMGYLIVEPYQVRLEVLVAATAVQRELNAPSDPATLDREMGQLLRRGAVDLVGENAILIDGARARPASAVASFVTIGTTGVSPMGDSVPPSLDHAILGVTLLYQAKGLPRDIGVEWSTFSDDRAVPLSVRDPAATTATTLAPDTPRFEWRNTLGEYALPTIQSITAEPPRLPLLSVTIALLAVMVLMRVRLPRARWAAVGLVLVAYAGYPFVRVSAEIPIVAETSIRKDQAADVLERLLTNVYRAFDIHSEEAIYDQLALTVTGDQLLEVYLESRQALELENRGGARVRVDEVSVREVRSVKQTPSGFTIDAVWVVGGSVGHFGHDHFRQNRYDALIEVVPVEGVWKINGVEISEEIRVL